MRSPLRLLVAGVAALALLTGCVSIPTSGSVRVETLDTEPDEVPNVALPSGPTAGQSPIELVRGFLRAGRAPQTAYSIARQYLTEDATWSGTDRVLVTSSSIQPVAVDDDTVALTVTVVGEVDARGVYTAREPQAQTLSYDLELVDGEYRIARADPGTVLSRNGFETAFGAYPLYYFDVSFQALVPDLRWFPATRAVGERIVDELLLGPAPWLASPVAVSAFPAGTEAQTRVAAPQVTVDLSSAVRAESDVVQRRMFDQIERSLAALGNVTEIDITAGGLDLAPADPGDAAPEWRYLVGELVGGRDGAIGTLTTQGVTPLPGIGTRADGLDARAASLGRGRDALAVLGAGGVTLLTGDGRATVVDARGGLLAPSLDRYGYVWTSTSAPGSLVATAADVVAHPVALPVEGSVVSVDVSRDGSRLLVALAGTDGSSVLMFGIQRDAAGVPVGLGAPYAVPVDGVLDVAWVDSTSIAVLRTGDDEAEVEVHPLGGPVRQLGTIESGRQIVGGNGVAGLHVLTADGVVYRPGSAGGWIARDIVASFLVTQQ